MKRVFITFLILGTSTLWAEIEPIHFDPPAAPAPAPAAQPAAPESGAKAPATKTKKGRKHHSRSHPVKKAPATKTGT